jgi:pimeloyl-ACP methyl ester carboxylesterase
MSTSPRMDPVMSTSNLTVGGLSFSVEDTGGDGPSVLLLHGFPDSKALWRHQIPALAAAGYRVIAPDLRGFGASDRPEGVEHYRMELLAGDVLGILDALDIGSATVVGHDWGSALGWGLAGLAPERVGRFVALSVGHPSTYMADLRQLELSWYMLFSSLLAWQRRRCAATVGRCCASGCATRWTSSATSPTWIGPVLSPPP